MTDKYREVMTDLLTELLKIGRSIDEQARQENKDSLLYGFLLRQLTSINILLEQIQYNFLVFDTIGIKITGTDLTVEPTEEKEKREKENEKKLYDLSLSEDLVDSLMATTPGRHQRLSTYLLCFVVITRTNFENFINIIFDTVVPDKGLQRNEKLKEDIEISFGKNIDINSKGVQKFIKDRCKEYSFTHKLDLICKDRLDEDKINGLKNLYKQRNSLHGLGVSKNDEVVHFKEGEEDDFISYIINILTLTRNSATILFNHYKKNFNLEDITGIKQEKLIGFK